MILSESGFSLSPFRRLANRYRLMGAVTNILLCASYIFNPKGAIYALRKNRAACHRMLTAVFFAPGKIHRAALDLQRLDPLPKGGITNG
jgi:hypothetical protein